MTEEQKEYLKSILRGSMLVIFPNMPSEQEFDEQDKGFQVTMLAMGRAYNEGVQAAAQEADLWENSGELGTSIISAVEMDI